MNAVVPEGTGTGRRAAWTASAVWYAYALLGADRVAAHLTGALAADESRPWAAGLLAGALAAETFGWAVRRRRWRARPEAADPAGCAPAAGGTALAAAHAVLAYMLGFLALDAMGWLGGGVSGLEAVPALAVTSLVLFVREAAMGGMLLHSSAPVRPVPAWLDGLAETALLGFRCIAYTAYWQVMMAAAVPAGWGLRLALAGPIVLVFFIVYLPLRLPDILDERGRGAPVPWKRLALEGALLGLVPVVLGPG